MTTVLIFLACTASPEIACQEVRFAMPDWEACTRSLELHSARTEVPAAGAALATLAFCAEGEAGTGSYFVAGH